MSKRFRIAFSFAGEKRAFVEVAASILAKRFGQDKILYDKYHEAEFARYDLGIYLPKLYSEQSDLIVPVLCPKYDAKRWTGWEWIHIYGLLTKADGVRVMPSRFEFAQADGLSPASGFIELDHKSPEQFANLILERLANNEGHPNDHYTRDTPLGPDWPIDAPPLDWPVADHREAQGAFKQLITRTAPFRLLLVRGVSDTGKTHLTKQFHNNMVNNMPGITCAPFDFKGSSDMDKVLRTFAQQLEVSPPTPGTGVTGQLTEVFASLKKAARPTLLIFDTFEMAGEAERWVKDILLLSLARFLWLRVIIIGQRVPAKHGESWEKISSDLIELRPPTPQEWFEFGKRHEPSITLEDVRTAHRLARGASSLMAGLLGPKT